MMSRGTGLGPANLAANDGVAHPVPRAVECTITVNGAQHQIWVRPDETLVRVLRGVLGLTGTKESCGRGECGACTVLVGGQPVMSCLVLVALLDDPVATIEGLSTDARLLGERFADLGGFQCGYCTPGHIVRAIALLRSGEVGDERELRRHISGNLCRCTGYNGIVDAIQDVAGATRGEVHQ